MTRKRTLRDRCALTLITFGLLIAICPLTQASESEADAITIESNLYVGPVASSDAMSLFSAKEPKQFAYEHLLSGEQICGASVAVTAADILLGSLQNSLTAEEACNWLAFLEIGGELSVFRASDEEAYSLIGALPVADVDDTTHVKTKQEYLAEHWFREFIQELIDSLNRIGDPDTNPDTSPNEDPTPSESGETAPEDTHDDIEDCDNELPIDDTY